MNKDVEKQLLSTLIPIRELIVPSQAEAEGATSLSELKKRASVLVPLLEKQGEWHVLLTLRAATLRYHASEVAFPGGMWEEGDRHLVDTALRECEEEIAVPVGAVTVMGGLEATPTRRLTDVVPIVGLLPSMDCIVANPQEIAEVFTVPLRFFEQDSRLRTDIFQRGAGATYSVPAYQYGDFEIWGFTAAVIVQLLQRSFGMRFPRQSSAPEKKW